MTTEIDQFTKMLREFNSLIVTTPAVEKVKNKLLDLKRRAELSVELNYRQKDAIIARCDNYINGTYGNTKNGIEFKGA